MLGMRLYLAVQEITNGLDDQPLSVHMGQRPQPDLMR